MLRNKSVAKIIFRFDYLSCRNLHIQPFNAKVIVSKSNCPFKNLAYENFIYENEAFLDNQKTLFIWRNRSSVIIGRHQNPWKEVNLKQLKEKKIHLCRRMSGGGSVYHDLGNVNFTFFTSKANYDRKKNLEFIINTLKQDFGICLERNNKDDILLENQYKVSGTAAKLGLKTCYHHCTLLCDSNLANLRGLLKNPFGLNISTNATESVKSNTRNLFIRNDFDFDKIVDSFSSSFFKQYSKTIVMPSLHILDPTFIDQVSDQAKELQSWQWTFGKSPKFSIQRELIYDNVQKVSVKLIIHKGNICDFELIKQNDNKSISHVMTKLCGSEFRESSILPILLELSANSKYLPICLQLSNWFEDANMMD
ncbi:lipoyl amidotransferase LIPT1, mitochondrial-like [Clytia hemisphaerica]|uniref:lipoyl amidotransferase LIPT1, mitochondrial-like n=1 Tax=Clytia hemisphaerica TaxID=252671 RepID=UPI0034D5BCFE